MTSADANEPGGIDLLAAYRDMLQMRFFEEAVATAVAAGEIHGEMHVALGQEAIAAGLRPHMAAGDAIVSTHRPHLHALIAGVDPVAMLTELFERDGGLSGGKGGHMHLFDPTRNFMCTGIVGASIPIALGYAFAFKYRQTGGIAIAAMGDGAANIGAFFESLNLAALWKLPVLFLIEDNGYGISVRREDASAGALEDRGQPFGIPTWDCDGTDVEAVAEAARDARTSIDTGEGPSLLVARAHRFSGHYEGDLDLYRPADEREASGKPDRDPIARTRLSLEHRGHHADALTEVETQERTRVSAWVEKARSRPWPKTETAFSGVFA